LTLLRDVLDEAAAGLPEIETSIAPDGSIAWSRAGQPFAVLSPDGTDAEFALDVAVAAAAARTPDVAISGRGPGWVRFSPNALDDHAVDRAVAWFASAHRRLGRD
jgi:hypothetical protein